MGDYCKSGYGDYGSYEMGYSHWYPHADPYGYPYSYSDYRMGGSYTGHPYAPYDSFSREFKIQDAVDGVVDRIGAVRDRFSSRPDSVTSPAEDMQADFEDDDLDDVTLGDLALLALAIVGAVAVARGGLRLGTRLIGLLA